MMFTEEFSEALKKSGWEVAKRGVVFLTKTKAINVFEDGRWFVHIRNAGSGIIIKEGQEETPTLAVIAALHSFVE